jgi:branched-chain amino acid aminotransferase
MTFVYNSIIKKGGLSMDQQQKVDLNWGSLGFNYIKTDKRFLAHYKEGKWNQGIVTENSDITISEGSTVFHYGQSCFEGLKAFTANDGRILIFRPDQNALRMQSSCRGLLMASPSVEMFVNACIEVCLRNWRFIPPYGSGAAFYLRPFLFGCGENLGVKPAKEYIFSVFGSPVGPYFKSGFKPVQFCTTKYNRAAPQGTGGIKVGGNYGASLLAHQEAIDAGYTDAIYLDPRNNTDIEEVGAANFFGITRDNKFVTPKSPSILPSITKYSLMHIAKRYLDMEVEERRVSIHQLDEFSEAGACGTAAVITPIGGIMHNGKLTRFYKDGQEAGPISRKLYELLTKMQCGDMEAPENWVVEVK